MSIDTMREILSQLYKERRRAMNTIKDNQALAVELKRYKHMIDEMQEQILNTALKIKQGDYNEK